MTTQRRTGNMETYYLISLQKRKLIGFPQEMTKRNLNIVRACRPENDAALQLTQSAAFAAYPERFVKKPPTPPNKRTAVWINPPQTKPQPPGLN
jgi:hypothetical protein